MAFSVVPTVATGDLWTAANHNTYIRDNFAAGVPALFTAAGDLAIGSGVGSAAQLPVGAQGKLLKVLSSGLPGWGGPQIKRYGGSPTDWTVIGSTPYAPDDIVVQMGAVAINNIGPNNKGSVTVTFPSAFSGKPMVFCTVNNGNGLAADVNSISTTQTNITIFNDSTLTMSAVVYWMAIGSPAA